MEQGKRLMSTVLWRLRINIRIRSAQRQGHHSTNLSSKRSSVLFWMENLVFMVSEKMLLLYLHICSWNGESPFQDKNSIIKSLFRLIRRKRQVLERNALTKLKEAIKLAKEATGIKMKVQCEPPGSAANGLRFR